MALKDIRSFIEQKVNSNTDEGMKFIDSFIEEYKNTVVAMEMENRQSVPTDSYRPSQLSAGCVRMLYYQRKGVESENTRDSNLNEICDMGTDRHERIQNTIKNMENVTYLDVEEVLEEAKSRGINTKFIKWNEDKTEVRLLNTDYGLYFQPDGMIRYKGKDIIIEIKTINSFAFNNLKSPKAEHLEQATCYSLGTGLDKVLFIYEERNFMNKKLFFVDITDSMKRKIIDRIDTVNSYVARDVVPPRDTDKCKYCNYKNRCIEDLKKEDDINGEK